MTSKDLLEILARHGKDGALAPSTWEQESVVCAQIYKDRGELLSFLLKVARAGHYSFGQLDEDRCHYCGETSEKRFVSHDKWEETEITHLADCPGPELEGFLKGEAGAGGER